MRIITQKEWVSAVDSRARVSHANANGQVVDNDKPFIIGSDKMMYPGDLSASTENLYNCRCSKIDKVIGFDYNKVNKYVKQDIPAKDYKIIGKVDNLTEEKAIQILEKYEKQILNQDFETVIIISKNGTIYKVDGIQSSVNIALIGVDNLKSSYITHNHPKTETSHSFSEYDIQSYKNYKLRLLRGIDEKYIYSIENGKISDILISLLDANFKNFRHSIVTAYCNTNGMKYRRWKNDKK